MRVQKTHFGIGHIHRLRDLHDLHHSMQTIAGLYRIDVCVL